jgi:hypothetical protein
VPGGVPRGLAQQRGDPRFGAARHRQQVGGDLLRRSADADQDARGALMLELALGRREVVVDAVSHERMHEVQRHLGAQDLGADQRPRRVGHPSVVEPGEAGGDRQPGPGAEHRHGAGNRERVIALGWTPRP